MDTNKPSTDLQKIVVKPPNTMQNWQGDRTPMQPGPNVLDVLKALVPTTPADSAQGNFGPATLTQLGAAGKSTADAIGPYQQGVAKALKDLGQQHVQEAHAAGMSPTDIQDHPIMQNGQQQSDPNAMAILSSLISMNNANTNQFNAVDANNAMMKKASDLSMQEPSSLFGTIQKMLSSPSQQTRAAALQIKNISDAQSIIGQQQQQASEVQKNLLPMTAYERAQTGVQKATMLLNYGGKVSEDFQKTIQPHIDTINDSLNANTLYQNVLANPNNQQAQQAFLEASAKLQGVKDSKMLMQGRGALSAGKGAVNQFIGGGGFSQKELSRIQAANIAKYNVSQKAMDLMTKQHQARLGKLGLDPDQFVNQYGQSQSSGMQEGMTATNPQTGQKITFRGGKWQ